jgi:hypothetical protein
MNEEFRLKSEILMELGYNFSQYVKEMNLELWTRAVDFAATMTKVDGIEFGRTGEE